MSTNKNAYEIAETYTARYGQTVTEAEKKKRITAFGIKKDAGLGSGINPLKGVMNLIFLSNKSILCYKLTML